MMNEELVIKTALLFKMPVVNTQRGIVLKCDTSMYERLYSYYYVDQTPALDINRKILEE